MDHSLLSITWKEWRAKALPLSLLAAVALLGHVFARLLTETFYIRDAELESHLFVCSVIGAIVGALFMSRDEDDPARSFLYQLPIPRRRIFLAKLANSSAQWLTLTMLLLIVAWGMYLTQSVPGSSKMRVANTLQFLPFMALPLWIIAALFIYLVRSSLVALVLTAVAWIPTTAIRVIAIKEGGRGFDWLILMSLLFTALIACVFYLIFTRSAVHERSGNMRSLIAVLAVVAIVEGAFTLFFTGWRDLWFALTGM